MQHERLGVVVVGTGGIGKFHLENWNALDDAQVVGVYDIHADVARAAAQEYDVPTVYETLEDALADPRTRIVDVCTPNMLHKQVVLAALRAGKHCLCEKPLAAHSRDIEEMIAARNEAGTLLMTAQHMRFETGTAALKRMIAAGELGDVYYTRAWWLRRRRAPATPGFLLREQAGFGPGMDLGVHLLDLVLHLLNHPRPVSVSGVAVRKLADQPDLVNEWGTFNPTDFEVEDFAGGLVRFADGSALSLEVSWLLNMPEPEMQKIWLHGVSGGATWPDLHIAHARDGVLLDTRVSSPLPREGHRNAMRALLDAIRASEPSPVPPEESLQVARVLEALYESAAAGREIRLDAT
jgi:predicted dehydrogenase